MDPQTDRKSVPFEVSYNLGDVFAVADIDCVHYFSE